MLARLPLRHTVPATILVVGAAILLFDYLYERRLLEERLHADSERELRVLAAAAAGELESAFRRDREAGVGAIFERLGGNRLIDLGVFVDADGVIAWSTETRLAGLAVVEVGELGLGSVLRESRGMRRVIVRHEEDPPGLMGAFPVQMRDEPGAFLPEATGWLLVHYDLAPRRDELGRDLRRHTLLYAAVLSLLCGTLWLLFRRALLTRVQRLVQASRSIAKGDYDVELEVEGGDEVAQLATDFRAMAEALQRHSEQLGFLSRHDTLTGLLNRHGLATALEDAIASCRRDGTERALYHFDIVGFRVINDAQGHAAGDHLLQQVARRLSEMLPGDAILARPASDEFAAVLPLESGETVRTRAERLQHLLADLSFSWEGERYRVRFSIGAVPLHDGVVDAEQALGLAGASCSAAKESPHDGIAVWSPGDPQIEGRHGQLRWVGRIQSALDADRLALYAQQILPTRASGGLHLELLVRLLDNSGAPVSPARFLPAAERYRLVGQIDQWVIRNAFETLAARPAVLDRIEMCAINLSGMSLADPAVLELVGQGLEHTGGFPADRVCFEITETEAVTHLGTAVRFLERLRALGCRFALDDFGSGVSSFGYLKSLDVDLIKIDGVFVRGVASDPMDLAIVRSINDFAHETGKQTVAEFVESPAIMQIVRELGVDYMQGHAIGRAVPLETLLERARVSFARR